MSRSIPVVETQVNRQANPLASVVLNSAANVIGAEFGAPPFENEEVFDDEEVRRVFSSLENRCRMATQDLKRLGTRSRDIFKVKNSEEARELWKNAPLPLTPDERALRQMVCSYWGARERGHHFKTLAERIAEFFKERHLEAQVKVSDQGFELKEFDIKTIEYNFKLKPVSRATYDEAEKKMAINWVEPIIERRLPTFIARVLQDGFGDLKERLKIILTQVEPRPETKPDHCQIFWDDHLVHECDAGDLADGIKLCRDAAAWHCLNILSAKTCPSPNIAGSSTQSEGIMDSGSAAETGMPSPYPKELADVVEKLGNAGFQKEATGLMKKQKARGTWYARLQEKLVNHRHPSLTAAELGDNVDVYGFIYM